MNCSAHNFLYRIREQTCQSRLYRRISCVLRTLGKQAVPDYRFGLVSRLCSTAKPCHVLSRTSSFCAALASAVQNQRAAGCAALLPPMHHCCLRASPVGTVQRFCASPAGIAQGTRANVSGTRHENFGTTLSKCDRWIKDAAGTNANLSPGEPFCCRSICQTTASSLSVGCAAPLKWSSVCDYISLRMRSKSFSMPLTALMRSPHQRVLAVSHDCSAGEPSLMPWIQKSPVVASATSSTYANSSSGGLELVIELLRLARCISPVILLGSEGRSNPRTAN